jgi:hypothetical protein
MRATSNIAISTRSSTLSSRASVTGRIPRFTAMSARDYFRRIGAATLQRATTTSARDDDFVRLHAADYACG